jgi:Ni/Co efflux regulator RcnB
MKRFAIAATAALMAVGPLSSTASAQDYRRNDNGRYDRDHRNDNDRNDRRNSHRRGERWNRGAHNGYYVNGRWYFGPPPASVYSRSDYRPGYHQWRRGERLPSYYRAQYRQIDWRREHLRAPPRGYHYVRDDRGEVLLVGIATGVILSILLNN